MSKPTNKKQLGKGIRALLSNMDDRPTKEQKGRLSLSNSSAGIAEIPLQSIQVNPHQPRTEFDESALQELSDSIKLHGLIQPITVRKLDASTYQLISGERRFRASKMADLKQLPAYIREADDQGMLELALIENVQRQDLNAVEVAVSLERLVQECDLTHEELSTRIGKNRSTVTNYLRLLKLPPEVQKAIKGDQISMGHARALAGIENILVQTEVFQKILSDQLSVRATEKLIKQYQHPKSKNHAKSKEKDANDIILEQFESKLKSVFGNPVRIQKNRVGKGKLEIHFENEENLNYILDVLAEL